MRLFSIYSVVLVTVVKTISAERRDPFQQPFASSSIWNMPIGSDAEYTAADILDIFTALNVVTNNAPGNIGGGGIPRRPRAEPLNEPAVTGSNNLILNGDFSHDNDRWVEQIEVQKGYEARCSGDDGVMHVAVDDIPQNSEIWNVQFYQLVNGIAPSTEYTLSFTCRGTISPVAVQLMNHNDPWLEVGFYREIDCNSGAFTHHKYKFTAYSSLPGQFRLSFSAGGTTGDLYIDNVVLRPAEMPVSQYEPKYRHNKRKKISFEMNTNRVNLSAPETADMAHIEIFNAQGKLIDRIGRHIENTLCTIERTRDVACGVAYVRIVWFDGGKPAATTYFPCIYGK